MYQGAVTCAREVLAYARSYTKKTFLAEAVVVPPSVQKPSPKTSKPNFCRLTIQEPIQNLKAMAMGVVTAIALFWPKNPNPAKGIGSVCV
jgi:inosine-uridine nucleoside N-ribohydrolase